MKHPKCWRCGEEVNSEQPLCQYCGAEISKLEQNVISYDDQTIKRAKNVCYPLIAFSVATIIWLYAARASHRNEISFYLVLFAIACGNFVDARRGITHFGKYRLITRKGSPDNFSSMILLRWIFVFVLGIAVTLKLLLLDD